MIKRVGLALGSGGAKGIAHIGVLQALEENGVPIDIIAGSSIGAIFGAIYAVGTDLYMLAKLLKAINTRNYLDMTVPRAGRGGVVLGERIQEFIALLTHNKTFEQTRIPFMCSAVDVETGELITFRSGKKLHECVRASMSMPGVFTPMRLDGRLLIDGGVIERVPCIPLREAGADIIIGVDVGYRGEGKHIEQATVLGLLDRTIDIMQWELTKFRLTTADVILAPQVRGLLRGFSTENTDEGVEEGRRVTLEALPRILELLNKKGIPLKNKQKTRTTL